jgi:hypothetical protein
MSNNDNSYADALYASMYKHGKIGGLLAGLAIAFILATLIVLLIFRSEKNVSDDLVRTVTVVCSIVITAGVLVVVLLTILPRRLNVSFS